MAKKPQRIKGDATAQIVLDGSVTLAWLFADERSTYADAIIERLPTIEMLVPRLWHLEVANVLAVCERRGRCTPADTTRWLGFLSALPITVDPQTERQAWSATITLARQCGLTAYDAAYLELSIRRRAPLATLDNALIAAAETMGAAVLPP